MTLLLNLLPYLFRLTLAFQGQGMESIGTSIPEKIFQLQEATQEIHHLTLYSNETNLPPLARKLETEEKEIEFYDLLINSSIHTTSYRYFPDTSLCYFDYRKTHDNPHLYDLFRSWKTHLS